MTTMPPVHPAAAIFPMFGTEELAELGLDIQQNGLRDAIVMYEGQILDGRNRWTACDRVGVEPRFEEYTGTDPVGFVVSKNLRRRHLDESQRAMVAARVRELYRQQAKNRQAAAGRARGRNATSEPEMLSANLPKASGAVHTDAKAAKQLNVSPRAVRSATKVLTEGVPELVEAVDTGRMAVSTASEVAAATPEQQREIVARGPKEILAAAKAIRSEKTQKRRAERTEKLGAIARGDGELFVEKKYPVILADPPWKYADGTTDPSRVIANKYPPMELEAIKALPVKELATPAAVLFMWAVNPLLPEALEVMEAWGFEYRTNWAWDKEVAGMGVWGFGQHELLLIGVRGDMPTAPENTRPPSMIRARRGEHSEKPAEAAERIARMFPTLPKIELFARASREGWAVWGNQAPAVSGPDEASDPAPEESGDHAAATAPVVAPAQRHALSPLTSQREIDAALVESPDGEVRMCTRCGMVLGVEREHSPMGRIKCEGPFVLADVPPERRAPAKRASEYACLECHAEPGEPHADTCDDAGSIVRSVAEQNGSETAAATAGPLVCRVPTPAEQQAFALEHPEYTAPKPPPLDPPPAKKTTRKAAPRSAGEKCTECSAKPGKLHVEGCSRWPLTVPSVDGEREDGSKKIKRADGRQTQRGICSELALRAIQSGNLDGARAWIVKLEFFGDTERVRGLRVILEREEQHRARRPHFLHVWCTRCDRFAKVEAGHPAWLSKRAKALIGHAEGAIAVGNYDSAAEAIDELDGISSGAVTAEHTHDAAERLRVYGAHMKATHGEAPPPRARRAAATTKVPTAAGPSKKKRIKVVKGDDGSEREVDGAGA